MKLELVIRFWIQTSGLKCTCWGLLASNHNQPMFNCASPTWHQAWQRVKSLVGGMGFTVGTGVATAQRVWMRSVSLLPKQGGRACLHQPLPACRHQSAACLFQSAHALTTVPQGGTAATKALKFLALPKRGSGAPTHSKAFFDRSDTVHTVHCTRPL